MAEQEKIRREQEKEAEMMARLEKIPPTQISSPPPIDVDARMAQMQAKTPSQLREEEKLLLQKQKEDEMMARIDKFPAKQCKAPPKVNLDDKLARLSGPTQSQQAAMDAEAARKLKEKASEERSIKAAERMQTVKRFRKECGHMSDTKCDCACDDDLAALNETMDELSPLPSPTPAAAPAENDPFLDRCNSFSSCDTPTSQKKRAEQESQKRREEMIMERSARADSVSPKSPSPKPNGEAFLDRASSFTSCDTPTSQKKKADAEAKAQREAAMMERSERIQATSVSPPPKKVVDEDEMAARLAKMSAPTPTQLRKQEEEEAKKAREEAMMQRAGAM